MAEKDASGPKRRDDDCAMVTSLQSAGLSKTERCLHEAARKNDCNAIKKILSRKANSNCKDSKNHMDRTPLHIAASQGNLEAVEELIKRKAVVEVEDKYGMSPLLWAAYFGHVEVVQYLAKKGGSLQRKNKQGMGVQHLAAENNSLELLEHIIANINTMNISYLEDKDNNGMTPLLTAAFHGSVTVLNRLIEEVNTVFTCKDLKDRNTLHLACIAGRVEMIENLLNIDGIPSGFVDDKDKERKTPLHYACEKGYKDAVELLLSKEADVNLTTDMEMTPMMIAAQSGFFEIVRVLVDAGADINAHTEQGNTALHLAALTNLSDTSKIRDTLTTLIDMGADIDEINNRLQTALHSCVEQNKPDAAEVLLLRGANTSLIDKTGKTPLLLASRGSYVSLVDMIIKSERYHAKKKRAVEGIIEENGVFEDPDEFKPQDYRNVYNVEATTHTEEEKTTFQLKVFNQPYAEEFKTFLWRLSFKHLRAGEWQRLAYHWNFRREHIMAIEHQYTGEFGYKQHGYRVLCIWFHGVDLCETPIRELYEALVSIGRRELADRIRSELDAGRKRIDSNQKGRCVVT